MSRRNFGKHDCLVNYKLVYKKFRGQRHVLRYYLEKKSQRLLTSPRVGRFRPVDVDRVKQ